MGGARGSFILLAPGLALFVSACDGPQSALDPAGEAASEISQLTDFMFVGSVAITLLVTVLAIGAFRRNRRKRPGRNLLLFGGGLFLPVIVISALVTWSGWVGGSMYARVEPGEGEEITVNGYQFWWEMTYHRTGPGREQPIVTANELYLPVNRPAVIHLKSPDVIHSFWVPSIAGKIDLIPGRTNRIVLKPTRTGVFRGQCAEYCGEQHANMAFMVVVVPQREYEDWLIRQSQPAARARIPLLKQGEEVFISQGCGACHRIDGLPGADGRRGPDLTHVGSRMTLAAGMFPNTVGNFGGWIASAQHLKPGNEMPSFDRLTGDELRALASYMESLQ